MNFDLRYEIVKHVFYCLGIINSNFIKSKSFVNKDFFLTKKILFDDDKKYNLFGVDMPIYQNNVKFLLTDVSVEYPEFYLTIALEDAPVYGLYISEDEAFLACNVEAGWLECNTHLQLTFLTAMEQIRDMGSSYSKLESYDDGFDKLLDFINFHNEQVSFEEDLQA